MKKKTNQIIQILEKTIDLIEKCGGPGGKPGPCPKPKPSGTVPSGSSKAPPAKEGNPATKDAPKKARVTALVDDTPQIDEAVRSFAKEANLHFREDPMTAGSDMFGGMICKKSDKPKLDDYLKKMEKFYESDGKIKEPVMPKEIGSYRFDHRSIDDGLTQTMRAVKDIGGSAEYDDNQQLLVFSWKK